VIQFRPRHCQLPAMMRSPYTDLYTRVVSQLSFPGEICIGNHIGSYSATVYTHLPVITTHDRYNYHVFITIVTMYA
jgi:hypothetical protein